jgi:hypothetical protein
MPDWNRLVRAHMARLRLPHAAKEEVISELAAHLNDAYEAALARNLDESEAKHFALSEIDWHHLALEIQSTRPKEETMNPRAKGLWLPAMANLLIAAALLTTLGILGVQPRRFSVSHMPMAIPLPWLFALPLSGAAAAFLAKRAQAPLAARLIAGLAPSLVWLAVFTIMTLAFALDRHDFAAFPLDYFAVSAVAWIVLPAISLGLGTLPFLRESALRKA